MLIVLLVFTLLLVAAGAGLLVASLRREETVLGVYGLAALITAGIPASVYGVLASA